MFSTGFRLNNRRFGIPLYPMHRKMAKRSARVNLWDFTGEPMDQGATGSCVGHARAMGIALAAEAFGKPLDTFPSPRMLYTIARCYERADYDEPLNDNGCDPVDSIAAAKKWGVGSLARLRDRFSDCEPATINEPPDLLTMQRSVRVVETRDYVVSETGDEKLSTIAECLAAGMPVCIDVYASGAEWQDYTNGIISLPPVPTDHYVLLLSCETLAGNKRIWRGMNSWGESWGIGGTFLVDDSVVLNARCPIVCVGE